MRTGVRERVFGAFGAAGIVGLLGYAMLAGMRVDIGIGRDRPIMLLAIDALPPPPPVRREREVVAAKERMPRPAAPPAPRTEAIDIATPRPIVLFPFPIPIVAATTANTGAGASRGSADEAGSGQGTGGVGDGNGGGGDGGDTPPRRTSGHLKFSYLSPDLRAGGAAGTVSVHYTVGMDGRASDCRAVRSSGNSELDRQTCALIEQHFRFAPSRDAQQRSVESDVEESHSWLAAPPK